MDKDVKEICDISMKHGYKHDDLIAEAECLEEYGEYLHMSLVGFSPEQLMEAAKVLEACNATVPAEHAKRFRSFRADVLKGVEFA